MGGKWIEIAILMEQKVAVLDTEGRNDQVSGFAHGDAPFAELSIMPCSPHSEGWRQHGHHGKLADPFFDRRGVRFIASATQDFEENDIPDEDLPGVLQGSQHGEAARNLATQQSDPDRRVDDDHR